LGKGDAVREKKRVGGKQNSQGEFSRSSLELAVEHARMFLDVKGHAEKKERIEVLK